MTDKPHDYCGIFGVFNHSDAALLTYYGLHALQHRGQESAGIVTSYFDEIKNRQVMPMHKDFGLVLTVFDDHKIFNKELKGRNAIGHNGTLPQDHRKIRQIFSRFGFTTKTATWPLAITAI